MRREISIVENRARGLRFAGNFGQSPSTQKNDIGRRAEQCLPLTVIEESAFSISANPSNPAPSPVSD
jgi:hypothetical protein